MNVITRAIGAWPAETPRQPSKTSHFKVDRDKALRDLARELDFLGAGQLVLELDYAEHQVRSDGSVIRGAQARGPAVIVSAVTDRGPLRMACCTYWDATANIRAIGLTLEALRAIDRFGAATRGEQYTGWLAIPPSTSVTTKVAAAWAILFRESTVSERDDQPRNRFLLDTLYSKAARRAHPDAGGSDERMSVVNRARDTILVDLVG